LTNPLVYLSEAHQESLQKIQCWSWMFKRVDPRSLPVSKKRRWAETLFCVVIRNILLTVPTGNTSKYDQTPIQLVQ